MSSLPSMIMSSSRDTSLFRSRPPVDGASKESDDGPRHYTSWRQHEMLKRCLIEILMFSERHSGSKDPRSRFLNVFYNTKYSVMVYLFCAPSLPPRRPTLLFREGLSQGRTLKFPFPRQISKLDGFTIEFWFRPCSSSFMQLPLLDVPGYFDVTLHMHGFELSHVKWNGYCSDTKLNYFLDMEGDYKSYGGWLHISISTINRKREKEATKSFLSAHTVQSFVMTISCPERPPLVLDPSKGPPRLRPSYSVWHADPAEPDPTHFFLHQPGELGGEFSDVRLWGEARSVSDTLRDSRRRLFRNSSRWALSLLSYWPLAAERGNDILDVCGGRLKAAEIQLIEDTIKSCAPDDAKMKALRVILQMKREMVSDTSRRAVFQALPSKKRTTAFVSGADAAVRLALAHIQRYPASLTLRPKWRSLARNGRSKVYWTPVKRSTPKLVSGQRRTWTVEIQERMVAPEIGSVTVKYVATVDLDRALLCPHDRSGSNGIQVHPPVSVGYMDRKTLKICRSTEKYVPFPQDISYIIHTLMRR